VVAIDTEFEEGVPPSRAALRALSIAGGTPETGLFATSFVFEQQFARFSNYNWRWLFDRVLTPIYGDPERAVVMHPLKVDMQLLRARGLTDAMVRCKLEDTIAQTHVWDDNLPHSLKDLGQCILGAGKGLTYRQTQNEIKRILKAGDKLSKKIVRDIWDCYRDHRKHSRDEAPVIDPTWPSWKRVAMALPPKLLKRDVVAAVQERVRDVVMGDYEQRAYERFAGYAADDAIFTLALRYRYQDTWGPEDREYFELETTISHPIVTEMEERGLYIDVPLLHQIHARMAEIAGGLKDDVIRRFTVPGVNDTEETQFNPGSSDQLAKIIWKEWGLRPPPWCLMHGEHKPQFKRAKDGLCKADKDILDFMANRGGPHASDLAKLREYRQVKALLSDPIVPIMEMVTPESRLHATFWPQGARTGRFAHREPNVGNIPRGGTMPYYPIPKGADPTKPLPGLKLTDDGRWQVRSLRDIFAATPGMKYVSADLSQIENRIIAHVTQDPKMLWLYKVWDCAVCKQTGRSNEPLHACPNCGTSDKTGKRDKTHPDQPILEGFSAYRDIHSLAAASVTVGGKTLFEKYGPKEGRNRGKTYNHASTYGMKEGRVARNLGIKTKEAREGLEAWHRTFRGVRPLQEQSKQDIREQGYVTVLDGKKRRFPAQRLLYASGNFKKNEWEGVVREAVNVRAQGGTARVMKLAMAAIRIRLRERAKTDPRFNNVWLLNQVHDEINYEAPEEIAEEVLKIICWELEHAVKLSVAVIAEGAIGATWGQAH
jgi:DNA polymerase-1